MDHNGPRLYHTGASLETQYWLMKNKKNNTYQSMSCEPCSALECCRMEVLDASAISQDDTAMRDTSIQNNIFWTCRKYNMPLRYAIILVQVIFILIALTLAIVIFYIRHNKVKSCRSHLNII